MNLEIFLEKFNLFAGAPDAVAKMRELVLELAVQGRLSALLPGDDAVPSDDEFRENAAVLASSLGLRSTKELVEEAEPPFDIPAHWRWLALADIGAAQTGTTPSKTDHHAFNGEIPFIKPADIFPDSINYSNESLTRHGAESGSRLAPTGSLLMVCIGTIGKCNLIDRECAFNQQINSLTPVAFVDPKYLLVAARSRSFQDLAWKKSSSTTIAILNKGKWLSIPVPIAPLAEQKRIVAKVDELMALCDRLEAQQQERETRHAALARASLARFADAPTPANLNFIFHKSYDIAPADLRKSILTLAVQGKLVPQDPDDEPAETLLCKIQKRHAELQHASGLPKRVSQFSVGNNADESQPYSWKRVRIGELCLSIVPQRDKPLTFSGDIPWVTLPAFTENSLSLNLSSDSAGLSLDEVERYRLRVVPAGSVLMSCVGRFGLVALLDRDVVPNQQIHGFYFPADFLDGRFLCYSIMAQKSYLEAQSTTTTISYLNKTKCESVPVALPPLAEQRRIVAKVDELMALVDALETQLATARTTAEKVIEAVVAELTA
jgi:type I restriction enzyme S subunit